MSKSDLKLIKSYNFDKNEQHWGMCDEWVSKYEEEASGLHTFSYGEDEAYVVSSRYSGSGQSDGVDSEHSNNLFLWIHPIEPRNAEDEANVKAIRENGEDGYTGTYDGTYVSIRSEEAYISSIMSGIYKAIDGQKSSCKKKTIKEQIEKGEITVGPNAVKVYEEDYEPDPLTILDFDSETTLAEVWYLGSPCSSVGVKTIDKDSGKLFDIDRPLCCFYPISGSFGSPSVGAYIRHDGKKCINVYFSNNWDTGGSAVICAYVNEKPAPLTEEEVKKIIEFCQ